MNAKRAVRFAGLMALAAPILRGEELNDYSLVPVSTYGELSSNVALSNTVIELESNILIQGTLSISNTVGLVIDGHINFEVNGQGAYRCFAIDNSEVTFNKVTIKNCYISGNNVGAAIHVESSSLDMVDSVMESNYAPYGGCICGGGSSVVSLTRVAMTSNTAGYTGGGYYTTSSTASLSMTDCTLTSNSVSTMLSYSWLGGGGINIAAAMTFSLTRCTFDSNYARYYGGALRVSSGATGTLVDCVFKDNRAYQYGGAVAVLTSSTRLSFQGYEFDGNYDSSQWHDDIFRYQSATLNFADSCPEGSYNFGSGLLVCPNCVSTYVPSLLLGVNCKSTTGTFSGILTQSQIEEALMIDRKLILGADIDLSETVNMYRGVSDAALTGLVVDGGDVYSVDGGDAVRCFFVYGSGMDVAFRNMTMSNGYASSSSKESKRGAAVYVGGSATVRMSSVTITSSSVASTGSGGAVYVESSSLVMVDSVMSSNYASYGGCIGGGASSTVSLVGVSMFSNTAGYAGGGYYTSSSTAALTMTDCVLTSNSASSTLSYSYYGGGGINIYAAMTFFLTRCTFDSNYARYYGGALRVSSSATGTLVDCVFRDNHAYYNGGAVAVLTSLTRLSFQGYEFDGNYDTSYSHEDFYL